jgi:hypothetical protein
MEHRFYNQPKRKQRQIQLSIAFGAVVVVLLALYLSWITGWYVIGMLALWLVLSVIAPFFDVPAGRKSGQLTYHSLLFLAEKPQNGLVKIHGGTFFDYVFVLERRMSGTQRTNLILQQYLQGLLHFLEDCEKKGMDHLSLRGTSYVLNERTLKKLGFVIVRPDWIQHLILTYNYINLALSNSIAKNKIALPNLSQTRTFEANIHQLSARKAFIENLNERLKSKIASSP